MTSPSSPWLEALSWAVPLPDGPWSCLLAELGPRRVLATTPAGLDACDVSLLTALLEALGRPVDPGEHEAWLLCTPVPTGRVEGALRRLLHHPSYWVRQNAAWLVGYGATPASDDLLPLLDDPDNDVRRAAAHGLGRHGGGRAVAALLGRPWDADPTVDGARLEALALHLAQVQPLLDEVPEGAARQLLVAAVRAHREGDGEALAEGLSADSEPLRHAAGVLLAACPAAAAAVAERAAEVLRSASGVDSERGAVRALGAAGAEGVELAVALLGEEGWAARQCGAVALGLAGAAARDASAALQRALDDDDPDVQREAALALVASGAEVGGVRARLLRSLTREGGFLERAAAAATSLGPLDALWGRAEPGPELLSVLLAPGDVRLRCVAALLAGQGLGEVAGPLLEALALDEARRVPLDLRRAAAAGTWLAGHVPSRSPLVLRLLLGHAGGQLPQVTRLRGRGPELARVAFTDGDGPVRADALRALGALGAEAEPFAPLLAWMADHDPDDDVQQLAGADRTPAWAPASVGERLRGVLWPLGPREAAQRAESLRAVWSHDSELGMAVGRAVPLADDDRELAREAARLQGRALRGADAEAMARRALASLDDPRWTVREAAADLLGAMVPTELPGALRDEVVEALEARATGDYDADVQAAAGAAAEALGRQEAGWHGSR
jgi:HEAT repeat protein